jgi:PQQ-like domain
MRHAKVSLLCVLCVCLVALVAGCGSTSSSGGGTTNPGTFTIGADAAVTIVQGTSQTITVTPSSANGFTGSVQVSVSGLPAGVTATPATTTMTVGSSTTFTLTAAADAALGTTNVKVYGSSGTLSTSASVALTVTAETVPVPPDFSLAASPATLSLTQGASGQVTLNSTALNGFSGPIAVAVNGLPTGVTASPTTISVTPGTPLVVTLTAADDAPVTPTAVQVSFVGTSGTLTHTATIQLTVTAATQPSTGDFTLTAAPPALTLLQGASGQVTLNSTALNGFSGTISVAVNGLPTGVTFSPTTITVTPNNPLVVTLTAATDAPATPGEVQVSFVGTSGTLSHTATIELTVSAVGPTGPDFTITATPDMTVSQGALSDNVNVAVTGINGFSGSVAFTVSGLPAGVTAIPSHSTVQIGQPQPVAFQASDTATIGAATVTITGTSGALTHQATFTLTVTAPPPPDVVTLSLTPSAQTLEVDTFEQISVTANGPTGYTGAIRLDISGLPTGVTTNPSSPITLTAGVAQTITFTAAANATLGSADVSFVGHINSVIGTADLTLNVVAQPTAGFDVPTWHYDNGRTGLNAFETSLTPTSVTSAGFGKLSSQTTDGSVDAQPLFISGLTIGSVAHNVLYVVTENDSVYAFDADSGVVLWQVSALGANETASDDHGCSSISPKIGITATPVIDRNYQPNGAIFFVAMTKDSSGNYHQRLHALDLTTGAELNGSPVEITATFPGSGVSSDGTTNTFDPNLYVERAALLLSNSTIYLTWAAPCQQTTFDYSSWVMAYSEVTLQQQSVLNLTPNGSGGGIWMSGAGPAADANGDVFLITSKGTFDTTLTTDGFLNPVNGDYGNAYVEIQATNGVMSTPPFDYFEPDNGVPGSANYQDQGSGGVMVAPTFQYAGQPLPLAIGAGKDGNIYELFYSGTALGEYVPGGDNNQSTLTGALPNGATSSPAYFNQHFYYGGSGDALKGFTMNPLGGSLVTQSTGTLSDAGATPVISANGTNTAILWALDTTGNGGPVLHAYDATDLTKELYNTTQSAARDTIHATGKYTVPVVINGHVYIGTQSGVDVFGLLP